MHASQQLLFGAWQTTTTLVGLFHILYSIISNIILPRSTLLLLFNHTMSDPRKPNLFESMACGGTAAAFAVNFTHPIELVKTRMQASGGSIGATVSGVMKEGGVASFWKGLPFAYGRELSYTSVKLGACKLYLYRLLYSL